ncbi:MAG: aminotransferase class III-fold pyridoxal phosphate-dependent enzyme, partial [Deltaproteobacteria bacterium]|nr:aminotransferase class III-fold pyridoxal phosphate-dependent enzyme [Deltaproteobacteria bacterium]
MDKAASFEFILDSVLKAAGETLGLRPHQLGRGRAIAGLGLDPADLMGFEAEIRDTLGAEIPEGWLFRDGHTLEDLAREVFSQVHEGVIPALDTGRPAQGAADPPHVYRPGAASGSRLPSQDVRQIAMEAAAPRLRRRAGHPATPEPDPAGGGDGPAPPTGPGAAGLSSSGLPPGAFSPAPAHGAAAGPDPRDPAPCESPLDVLGRQMKELYDVFAAQWARVSGAAPGGPAPFPELRGPGGAGTAPAGSGAEVSADTTDQKGTDARDGDGAPFGVHVPGAPSPHGGPPEAGRAPHAHPSYRVPAPLELTPAQAEFADGLVKRFRDRTRLSREALETPGLAGVRGTAPGPGPLSGALAPPVVKHSAGARFMDLDGNDCLDFSVAMGVLGHNPPMVAEAVSRMLDRGLPGEGALSDAARCAAALAVPVLSRGARSAFFASEGSAMRAAVLLARAATGRRLVAAFSRNLPGLREHMAFAGDSVAADCPDGAWLADGRPAPPRGPSGVSGAEEAGGLLLLDYGSERALSALAEAAPRLAAAVVEPAPSSDLRFQSPSYLSRLCRAARERGAAVIFDETVLGPGFLPGGAGAWLGSAADLSVWGSGLSGGLPLGIVSAAEGFLETVDVRGAAGALGPPPHPLSLAALAGALGWLGENAGAYRRRAGELLESLSLRLNLWFQDRGAPLRLRCFGPFFRFQRLGPADPAMAAFESELFRLLLLESGVYSGSRESRGAGRVMAVSAAHGPDDIRKLGDAAVRAVQALREGGYGFAAGRGAPRVYVELPAARAAAFSAPEGESVAPSGREAVAFRLEGQVGAELLKDSLLELSARHEALNRSVRRSADGAWLKTEDEAPMRLNVVSDFASETDADAVRPFTGPRDPGVAPLAGAALIERGGYSVFLLESISAAVDRESLKILLRDLDALMRRQTQLLAPEDLSAAEAEVERYLLSPPSWSPDGVKGRAEIARERWTSVLSGRPEAGGADPGAPARDAGGPPAPVSLPLDNPLLKSSGRARLLTRELTGPPLDAYRGWVSSSGISPEVFFAGALALALARSFPERPGPWLFGRLWKGRPGPDSSGAVGSFARTALLLVPAPPAAAGPGPEGSAADGESAVPEAGEEAALAWASALQEAFRDSDRFRSCPAEDLAPEHPGVPEIRVSHEYLPPDLLSWPGAEGTFIPLPPSGGSSAVNLHAAEDRRSVHLFLKVSESLSHATSRTLLDNVVRSWERLARLACPALEPEPGTSDEEEFALAGSRLVPPGTGGPAAEGVSPGPGEGGPGGGAGAAGVPAGRGASGGDVDGAAPGSGGAGGPDPAGSAFPGAGGAAGAPSGASVPSTGGAAPAAASRDGEAPSGAAPAGAAAGGGAGGGETFGAAFPPEEETLLPADPSPFAGFPQGLPGPRRLELASLYGDALQKALPCVPGQEDWFLPGRLPAPPPSTRVEARRAVVRGILDPAKVCWRVGELCLRLDLMRLAVNPGTPPVNVLVRRVPKVSEMLRFADFSGLSMVQRERRLAEMTAADAEDLSDTLKAGGFRAALVKTGRDSSELVLSTSRLVFDPRSAKRVLEWLVSGTDGTMPEFPGISAALRDLPGPDGLERGLKSWKEALAPVDAPTRIPRRPGFSELKEGGGVLSVTMRLRPETNERLIEASAREGVPKSLFLAGVWAVVLGRLTSGEAVTFGMELPGDRGAGSRASDSGEAPLGPLALQMPLHAALPWGGTFSGLLREMEGALGRAAGCDFISRGGLAPLTPLGTDVFTHGYSYLPPFEFGDADVERVRESGSPGACSLSLNVRDHASKPELHFAYRTALYDHWQVEVIALAFQNVMDEAAAAAGETLGSLRLSDQDQDLSLVRQNNARPLKYSGQTALDLFAGAARENPDAVAVAGADLTHSYRDLDNESEKFAAQLKVAGYGPGSRVALVFGNGDAGYPAVLLGVLKSGACAVPLSAEMPSPLLRSLLEEASPDLVVCGQRLPQNLAGAMDALGDAPVADPQGYFLKGGSSGVMGFSKLSVHFVKRERDRVSIDPDSAAYMVYVSGRLLVRSGEHGQPAGLSAPGSGAAPGADASSPDGARPSAGPGGGPEPLPPRGPGAAQACGTGRPRQGAPRGVVVSHRALFNQLAWAGDFLDIAPGDVHCAFATPSSDVSLMEILVPLTRGAAVYPLGGGGEDALWETIHTNRVTSLSLPLRKLRRYASRHPLYGLKTILTWGRGLSGDNLKDLIRDTSGCRIVNCFGLPECAITSLAEDARPGFFPETMGRPVPNCPSYLLDREMRLVPAGFPGELYCGGVQTATCYDGRPGETARAFIRDPFATISPPEYHAGRLFRTGIMARRRPDGRLDYMGRAGEAAVVRGVRVPLHEVERTLLGAAGVLEALVVRREDYSSYFEPYLCAYLTLSGNPPSAASTVKAYLTDRLPGYMVPERIVILQEFPLDAFGRVDVKALPAPPADGSPGDAADAPSGAAAFPGAAPAHEPPADDEAAYLRLPEGHDPFAYAPPDFTPAERGRVRRAKGDDLALVMPLAPGQSALLTGGGLAASEPRSAGPMITTVKAGLEGGLDPQLMRRRLKEILGSRDVFRLSLHPREGGFPVQVWTRRVPAVSEILSEEDLRYQDARRREARLAALEARHHSALKDVSRAPLFRASLLRVSDEAWELMLSYHRLAFDPMSVAIWRRVRWGGAEGAAR